MTAINIVFDGPPAHESGRFVEVEDDKGHGLRVGQWYERPDGLWALRIDRLPYSSDCDDPSVIPAPAAEQTPNEVAR
jgi:hypothetical protein